MTSILRADLEALPEYTPAHIPDPRRVIKLDSNENPYGPSPLVLKALKRVDTWQYYYGQDDLRAALANYAQVNPDQLVITNGGDEAIDLVLRATLEAGDVVIDCPPSFEMYRISTLANRGRVVDVPRCEDFTLDTEAVVRACAETNAKAVCVASPSNPDGGLLPRTDLLHLLDHAPMVMLDEAYFEFAAVTALDLLPRYPNLVIVRTFSKWAGLAGLRVGYVIAAASFVAALDKLRAPYNVNLAAIVAARESLNDDAYLLANVRTLVSERERMSVELKRYGWLAPLSSATNFLLCRVIDREARAVREDLATRGILVRAFRSPRLREYIRITVGKPEQNAAVLDALRDI